MKTQTMQPTPMPFKAQLLAEVEKMTESEPRNPHEYDAPLAFLWQALGPIAQLPTPDQTPASFRRVRTLLLTSGLQQATLDAYSTQLTEVLTLLVPHGLQAECIATLAVNLRPRFGEGTKEPLDAHHLKTLLQLLPLQTDTVRTLFWLGLSGAPRMVDAAFLRLTRVNWDTGLISFPCLATGRVARFGALSPLLGLLRQRKARLGPNAVYALPEVLFSDDELLDPSCNTVPLEAPSRPRATHAAARATKAVNEFLASAGFPELTGYSALRRLQISIWASMGVSRETCSHLVGHRGEAFHHHWRVPLTAEILRTRDMTQQYLDAIQAGQAFFIPTTLYDLYDATVRRWKGFPETLRQVLREECGGTATHQPALTLSTIAEQMAHLHRKMDDQRRLIEELQKLVQAISAARGDDSSQTCFPS